MDASQSTTICPYCGDVMLARSGRNGGGKPRKQCGDEKCAKAFQRDRCAEWQREYRKKHGVGYGANRYPDKRSEYGRQWKENNPASVRTSRAISQAKRLQVVQAIEAESFSPQEIYQRDKWRCGVCGKKVKPSLRYPHPMSPSLDHIVPISEGGAHKRANTRCVHLVCNIRRRDRGGNEQLMLVG